MKKTIKTEKILLVGAWYYSMVLFWYEEEQKNIDKNDSFYHNCWIEYQSKIETIYKLLELAGVDNPRYEIREYYYEHQKTIGQEFSNLMSIKK